MLAVWEDVGLKWKKGATGIHKVQAREPILHRDLLRPQVLFDRNRKVCTSLNSGIVRNDHRLVTLNHSYAGDKAGTWRLIVIHAVRGERAEFEERRTRIQHRLDALAYEHLAAFFVALDRSFAAAFLNKLELGSEFGDQFL
jgi:hypothetical protein